MILINENVLVVTRHKGLVEYLKKQGLINDNNPVIDHATEEDIAGKEVIGVLPVRLASLAKSVTEVGIDIPKEMRGLDLSLEDMEKYVTGINTYVVHKLPVSPCLYVNLVEEAE